MLLKLQNIGKIYDSNNIFTIGIRGVDLEFDYNEFVIIEGESGSGKSTLLNVIGANDTYEEGELYINGMETSHYSESEWEIYREQNIATVFQDFNILENLTVLENVELALLRIENRQERIRIARSLIDRVGLSRQANQKGSRLSGGEKQRTVIARALAKDSHIILADEPTGNLDVKASREIAALLKEVSKDKLVIVVTHNPEFFQQYATRRVRIYDGHVSEDEVITSPASKKGKEREHVPATKKQIFANVLHIGTLNYKSRPKFTLMMSACLFVCAVTLFLVLSMFTQSLIQSTTSPIEDPPVAGKVILSGASGTVGAEKLNEIAGMTNAGYVLPDSELAMFEIEIAKQKNMLGSYTVTCLYAPYEYALDAGNAVLVIPVSARDDAETLKHVFLNAGVGLDTVTVREELNAADVRLYLGADDLETNGLKIRAVNSGMVLGENEWTVYTYQKNKELEDGTVALINSNSFEAEKSLAVLDIQEDRVFTVASADQYDDSIGGLAVQLSANDYSALFETGKTEAAQACLYYASDEAARAAVFGIPDGYMGMISASEVFRYDAGDIYTMNIVYYLALIGISALFAALISLIFSRSVKIFQTDFAVYRTLGISGKISSRSLYVQMGIIFLPTLLLLPLIKLYADSYIQLVDGELRNDSTIETTVDYSAELQRSGATVEPMPAELPHFEKSGSKRNGRLFSVGRLFRKSSEEKMYSGSNLFNRIFICVLAVIMCFFSFFTFEVLNTTIENKMVDENSAFAGLGVYSILRNIDPDTYGTLDFFELDMREGKFSYTNVAVLSGITEKYTPKALDSKEPVEGLYGEMPVENEVLISRELAERLKTDIRLSEMQNDNSLLLMKFDGKFRVSGIVPGDAPAVYMNRVDYINFLGIYSQIGFVDKNGLFLAADYAGNTFSAEIALADASGHLTDTQVTVEINRNSLYKMMANTSEADGRVEKANLKLATMTTALYLTDSRPLYVKNFKITRDAMTADVRIRVTQDVIDNIFMYLAPNLDALGNSSECYFELSAASPEASAALRSVLSEKGIPSVDIQSIYDARNREIVSDSMQSMTVFFIIMLLLFFIYFFIEKSGSVKNSKEYGVYRAIGVNRGNLIFKEAVSAFVNNIIPFCLFSVIVSAMIAGRYSTVNVAFTGFLAIVGISFVASAALMMLISVIPYLFIIFKTPSQILASYDI